MITASNILKITEKELQELASREGFEKRKISLDFSLALQKQLAEIGFDERYGARPLQRTIEQKIIAPLANWLLNHPKIENTKLYLDIDGMELKIALKN